jgi:hypothetical protein
MLQPPDVLDATSKLLIKLQGQLDCEHVYCPMELAYCLEMRSNPLSPERVHRAIVTYSGDGLGLRSALGRDVILPSVIAAIGIPRFNIKHEVEYKARDSLGDPPLRIAKIASPSDQTLAFHVADGARVSLTVSPEIKFLIVYADNRSAVKIRRWSPTSEFSVCLIASRQSSISMAEPMDVMNVSHSIMYSGQASSISGFCPVGDGNRIYTKDSGLVAFTSLNGRESDNHPLLAYSMFKWDGVRRWNETDRFAVIRSEHRRASVPNRGVFAPFFPLHDMLVRNALGGIPAALSNGLNEGEDEDFRRALGRAIAESTEEAPATGRKKILQQTVEKPIMFLREDPGSSEEEEKTLPSPPRKGKKRGREKKKAKIPAGEACVICLGKRKTHWSVGCAHLLYCDHCAHNVANTNEWKVCPLCNTPSRGLTYKPL